MYFFQLSLAEKPDYSFDVHFTKAFGQVKSELWFPLVYCDPQLATMKIEYCLLPCVQLNLWPFKMSKLQHVHEPNYGVFYLFVFYSVGSNSRILGEYYPAPLSGP